MLPLGGVVANSYSEPIHPNPTHVSGQGQGQGGGLPQVRRAIHPNPTHSGLTPLAPGASSIASLSALVVSTNLVGLPQAHRGRACRARQGVRVRLAGTKSRLNHLT
jgi:hypothetical protein